MDPRPWPQDTSREALEHRIEALRALGTEGRFAAGLVLCDEVRDGLFASVRARRPHESDEAVRRDVARLLLGEELFARAFNTSGSG